MSSIWHTKKETPIEDKTIFAQHKSFRDGSIECFMWEKQEFTDAIRKDVIAWCYLDDLLALETKLIRTRKALETAVEELTKIKVAAESVGIGFFMTAAISALVKIKTALEQKE